jgi:catechol-2,3-dioxygenase
LASRGHTDNREKNISLITNLGHVGIICDDLMKVRDFYTRVMGLTVTDENPERGICFLSADPENEHHELALSQARGADHPEGARPATENVGQISYIVPDMAALGELNRRFKEEKSISCVPSPTVSPAASTSTTQRTTWERSTSKLGLS